MAADRIQLRFALSKSLGRTLEICNNGFEQRIPVLYDNSGIEALALNNGISCTNGETIRSGMFFEPDKEQTITIGLAPVTIITHIEQYVKMLFKKLIENGKDSLFYFWVMRGGLVVQLLNDKLVRVTFAIWPFLIKEDNVMDAQISLEMESIVIFQGDMVRRTGVDPLQGKIYHRLTTFPVSPILFQYSSALFLAACFTSNECLNRARASSYVTFFASIILTYLTFHAAKIRISKQKNK